MKNIILMTLTVLTALAFAPAANCHAQEASVAEAAVKELVEAMARQGGREAATALAEMGGEAAIRELVMQAEKEGGEELVRKVIQYGTHYGPSALQAIKPSPAVMVRALDDLAPELVLPAIRATAREPEVLAKLVSTYGKDALDVAAKHPGVGTKLVEKLGKDGISIGRKISTDEAIVLARNADAIAALPTGERNQLLEAMKKSPASILDYLEKHPKVLLTAGGVAAVIAAKDSLFGGSVPAPNGGNGYANKGFIERVIAQFLQMFAGPITAIIAILGGGIVCWVAVHVWSAWRMKVIRHTLEEARAAAQIAGLGQHASVADVNDHCGIPPAPRLG